MNDPLTNLAELCDHLAADNGIPTRHRKVVYNDGYSCEYTYVDRNSPRPFDRYSIQLVRLCAPANETYDVRILHRDADADTWNPWQVVSKFEIERVA